MAANFINKHGEEAVSYESRLDRWIKDGSINEYYCIYFMYLFLFLYHLSAKALKF